MTRSLNEPPIVEAKNIDVPEVALDLDFAEELRFEVVLQKLCLVQHLQSEDKTGAPLPRHVDAPELPGPQRHPHVDVLQGECLR